MPKDPTGWTSANHGVKVCNNSTLQQKPAKDWSVFLKCSPCYAVLDIKQKSDELVHLRKNYILDSSSCIWGLVNASFFNRNRVPRELQLQ